MNNLIKQQLKEKFGDIVKFDEPLSNHTTYKIGGNAEVFIQPRNWNSLFAVLNEIREKRVAYISIGGGSNVLLPDDGFNGVVIKTVDDLHRITPETLKNYRNYWMNGIKTNKDKFMEQYFLFDTKSYQLQERDGYWFADAGAVLAKLAMNVSTAGYTGFEWGLTVPGTVGGAIRGNAGAFGGEIKDNFDFAMIYDMRTGEAKPYEKKQMHFSYRSSLVKKLKGDLVVLYAVFKFKKGDPKICVSKAKELLARKVASQPMGELTAGCVFKNVEVDPATKELRSPSTGEPTERFYDDIEAEHPEFFKKGIVPAAWMIDKLGLKGYEKGGIKVSEKHANFLVNTGKGTERAIKDMVEYIKGKVKEEYGVNLDEEVEFV